MDAHNGGLEAQKGALQEGRSQIPITLKRIRFRIWSEKLDPDPHFSEQLDPDPQPYWQTHSNPPPAPQDTRIVITYGM